MTLSRQIFYSMEGQAYFPDVGIMVRTGGDIWPEWDKCVLRNVYGHSGGVRERRDQGRGRAREGQEQSVA